MSKEIVDELISCFEVKEYKKNHFFAQIGNKEDKLGFVIEGIFYMYVEKEDGTFFTKDFICKNGFLVATFKPNQESEVSIQALTNCIILEMKYSDFMKLCEKYRELETLSRKGSEKRIATIYKRMSDFTTIDATERYELFKQEFYLVESEIPQYLVASYLGITPTQISRIRKNLKNSNNQHM